MKSQKILPNNLFAGQQWRKRYIKQSEVYQNDKDKYHILIYIYRI